MSVDQYGFKTKWMAPKVQARIYRQFALKKALPEGEDEYVLSHTVADPGFCRRLVSELRKELKTSDRVLSIAEGDGHLMRSLRARGFKNIEGVDICAELVAIGQSKGLELKEADASDLPFKRSVFDAVIINEAIGAIGVSDALQEARRVLKRKGKLIITSYNYAEHNSQEVFSSKMKYRYLTLQVITQALKDKKFNRVEKSSILIERGSDDRMDMIIARK